MTCAFAVPCSSENGEITFYILLLFQSTQVSPPRSFVHCNSDNFYLHEIKNGIHLTLSVSSLHVHELTSCFAAAGTDEVEKVTAVIK